jgi:hypothetical protein
MGKGRKLNANGSLGPLGHWLIKNSISITDFAKYSGLAYRTIWLAAHNYRIGYTTAEKILRKMKTLHSKQQHDVTISTLCSGEPRSNFTPTE